MCMCILYHTWQHLGLLLALSSLWDWPKCSENSLVLEIESEPPPSTPAPLSVISTLPMCPILFVLFNGLMLPQSLFSFLHSTPYAPYGAQTMPLVVAKHKASLFHLPSLWVWNMLLSMCVSRFGISGTWAMTPPIMAFVCLGLGAHLMIIRVYF